MVFAHLSCVAEALEVSESVTNGVDRERLDARVPVLRCGKARHKQARRFSHIETETLSRHLAVAGGGASAGTAKGIEAKTETESPALPAVSLCILLFSSFYLCQPDAAPLYFSTDIIMRFPAQFPLLTLQVLA